MNIKEAMSAAAEETYSSAFSHCDCKVCGGERVFLTDFPDTRSLFFANMTLISCQDCGVSYVPTRPKGLIFYYQNLYSIDKRRISAVSPEEMFGGRFDKYLAPWRSKDHVDLMRAHGGDFESILDVGAGYGMTLKRSAAARRVAIEVDKSMMPFLSHVGAEVHSSFDGIGDASIDAVMSSHYLEHLYIDDVFTNISEMLRVMKPDGVGLIEVPNAPLSYLDLSKARHAPHVVFFSVEAMTRIIRKCGGSIVAHAGRGDAHPLRERALYVPSQPYDSAASRYVWVIRKA